MRPVTSGGRVSAADVLSEYCQAQLEAENERLKLENDILRDEIVRMRSLIAITTGEGSQPRGKVMTALGEMEMAMEAIRRATGLRGPEKVEEETAKRTCVSRTTRMVLG